MKYKKNILFIVGGNYISGAEKVTLNVLQGLQEFGFRLFCITSGWTDGAFTRHLHAMNIASERIKLGWYYLSNIKWSLDSLVHFPKGFAQFYKLLKVNHYDVVYVVSFRFIILLYPLLKKNIIYHVHDPNSDSRQSKFFLQIADKKVLKYIAVSDFIKGDLIRCGINPNKIEVIYNGIEVISLKQILNNKQEKHTKKVAIGIVGQIIERKGHEDLIKAMQLLKEDKMQQVSLIIAGGGDIEFIKKLKLLIKQNDLESFVIWRQYKEDLYDIYRDIDIVVAPTRNNEPFGLVVIEANMLGLPVIVSRKGGLVEIVEDSFNGFIVEANNSRDLAEKIKVLAQNQELQKRMGEQGRERVMLNFSKKAMNFKICNLFESISS